MGFPRSEPYRKRDPRDRVGAPMRAFEQSIANGEEREFEVNSVTSYKLDHSLGRPYRGAIVVAISPPAGGIRIDVDHPDETTAVDPAKQVYLAFTGALVARVKVWVY